MMPSPNRHHDAFPQSIRGVLALVSMLYTVFVIYGSLVPLDYQAMPLQDAIARFVSMPFLQLGIDSRADWVANLLLFIPLSFVWMGALSSQRSFLSRAVITLPVLLTAVMLSLAIEFTQLYFPQRTVSQNDIFAEGLGALIGIMAWWAIGERYITWIKAAQLVHTRAVFTDRFVWVYALGLLLYNVLPLDLTISAVEIFHKWHEGKINLIPFARLPNQFSDALYELSTDGIIWAVIALLWCLNPARPAWRVWWFCVALAAVIEILQLFVYSRVSDLTDLIMAGIGAALGCVIARYKMLGGASKSQVSLSMHKRVLLPIIVISSWMVGLMLVFWFPFDFHTDGSYIKARLSAVSLVPFKAYYYSTEFRAITELLHKALFLAPVGGLLAWWVSLQPGRWRSFALGFAMVVLVAFPAILELGQLMLPNKNADLTDWLIMWAGGLTGYSLTRGVLRIPRTPLSQPGKAQQNSSSDCASPSSQPSQILRPITILMLLSLLFYFASKAAFLPYNVREMMGPQPSWMSALLLAFVCWWVINWPMLLANRDVSGLKRIGQLPLGLLIYGVVSFLLLYFSVSTESLHDLLGSPILQWPGQWEIGLRWLAFAAIPGALFYLATQTARRLSGIAVDGLQFWAAAPILILSYWGVVVQAASDNVVELIATPHPLAFAALCAWIYTLFLATLWIRSQASIKIKILAVLASLVLAYIFLSVGLDSAIQKYDQQFSALQFLLSTDRQHYASESVIWLRYVLLHLLAMMTIALMQYSRLNLSRPLRASFHAAH